MDAFTIKLNVVSGNRFASNWRHARNNESSFHWTHIFSQGLDGLYSLKDKRCTRKTLHWRAHVCLHIHKLVRSFIIYSNCIPTTVSPNEDFCRCDQRIVNLENPIPHIFVREIRIPSSLAMELRFVFNTTILNEFKSYCLFIWVTSILSERKTYSNAYSWTKIITHCDAIWRHRSMSILAQVMACCLTAPSHYLNQCWLIISEVLWHSPDSNLTENLKIFIIELSLKFTNLRLESNPQGPLS